MSEIEALKVYGERNTGTNYLTQLLEQNFSLPIKRGSANLPKGHERRTRMLRRVSRSLAHRYDEWVRDAYFQRHFDETLGWKHMRVPVDKVIDQVEEKVAVLMLVKHPYSWALSMHRRPYHQRKRAKSFSEFLLTPFALHKRDGMSQAVMMPLELWSEKVRSYVELTEHTRNAVILRYEDFLADEPEMVRKIADLIGHPMPEKVAHVTESTKGDAQKHDDYRRYYLEERWREKLSTQECDMLRSLVDQELVERLGYAL